jgi:hypothetical protein
MSRRGVWKVILEGWRYVIKDPPMRSLMFLVIVLNLCVGGPFTVGLASSQSNAMARLLHLECCSHPWL